MPTGPAPTDWRTRPDARAPPPEYLSHFPPPAVLPPAVEYREGAGGSPGTGPRLPPSPFGAGIGGGMGAFGKGGAFGGDHVVSPVLLL